MNYTYYRRYNPAPRRSSFKSFFWLVLILVALLLILRACVSFVGSLLKDKEDEATLTLSEGSAQVTEWGQMESEPVADAQLFLVGDTVATGEDSIVTLDFYNGTRVVLDQNTKLSFTEASMEEETKRLHLDLLDGRAFVVQSPEDEQELSFVVHTDVINIESISATYLVSNASSKEYVYGLDGQVELTFVDRSQNDSVIDTVSLSKGKKSVLTNDLKERLLARESVTLIGEAEDDLLGDSFVAYNNGEVLIDPGLGNGSTENEDSANAQEETVLEEEPLEEASTEISTETPSTLRINVSSPGLNSTIQKSAIAIEGSIVSGTADHVTVTWSGNNQPYTLAGFKPGASSFRYVADASYGNFKAGSNTFTVVAYAADGTISNTVTVVINAQF